jgi:cysteine synthase A
MTSGNMGSGLAVVCAIYGNPFVAVMSAGNSHERVKMLRGLGAEVFLVPQVDGSEGQVTGADIARASEVARQVARDRNAFYVDQFNNPGSILAHFETTGPEIFRDVGSDLYAFVAIVGSGGTFVGTSRFLKSKNPLIQCVAVEPEGANILAGAVVSKPKHLIQGAGYGIIPPHWDPDAVDKMITVSDKEAIRLKKELAEKEGLFVGYSAAANVAAAIAVLNAAPPEREATVVTVLCDTGLKY